MAVIPAGLFTLGSPQSEFGHRSEEFPQRHTRIDFRYVFYSRTASWTATPGDNFSHGDPKRILTKGGSWIDPALKTRSAARMPRLRDELDTNLGFRVLRQSSRKV